MNKNKVYTHVSLFSGAGGLDIGLEQAGFHTVWANDFNHDACETHRLWSNATVVEGDIGKVDYKTIQDCDIASFGFPCQGFSLSGPRKINDSRNVLYRHCVKLVEKKQPKLFLAENVKGLLTLGGGKIKDAIIADFESKGYVVSINLVNAADYHVPEDRQRILLVGIRKDLAEKYGVEFKVPAPFPDRISIRQALEGLAPATDDEICKEAYSSRYMSRNRKRGWDSVSFTIPAMAKQVPLWPGSPDMVKAGKNLSEDILCQAIGNRKVDVVVGGPPCQSYSTLGKRQMDARANLFMEYKRVLHILHPRAFLFENVKGILSMDKGALFEHVRKEFEDIGYSLQYKILNAVDYGVPQLRERVILVGFLGDNPFQYPEPTHGEGLLPYVTLQDALKDLPALACGEKSTVYAAPPDDEFLSWVRQGGSDTLMEHKAPNNSAHLRRIMETLKDGQGKDDLPEELRPKSGFKNTYAKLWWEKPATTITRNFACPSSSRCIHPRDSRALTIREGARLQSFPDNYQFYGSDCLKRLEIGNAVPPLLSVALAEQMLKALDTEK